MSRQRIDEITEAGLAGYWFVLLVCGHEILVEQRSAPRCVTLRCEECARAAYDSDLDDARCRVERGER